MTTAQLLVEEAQTATKMPSGRYRAVLARPGKGTSGTYSADMLKEFGPRVFPKGFKAYITHDEKRDPRDLLGSYPEGAWWDPNDGPEGALVSELLPLPSMAKFVEEVAPHVSLSIFAMGTKDEHDNVTSLVEHRTNGVDMVGYGGLEGSGLGAQIFERAQTLLEAARSAAPAGENKENSMTPEQMVEALKTALAEALAPVTTFISEQAAAAAAAKVAEEAAKGAVVVPTVQEAVAKFRTASDTIVAAKLFPTQEAALIAVAEEGGDITSLLEDAVKIRDAAVAEAATALTESASTGGRRIEPGADSANYGAGMSW